MMFACSINKPKQHHYLHASLGNFLLSYATFYIQPIVSTPSGFGTCLSLLRGESIEIHFLELKVAFGHCRIVQLLFEPMSDIIALFRM